MSANELSRLCLIFKAEAKQIKGRRKHRRGGVLVRDGLQGTYVTLRVHTRHDTPELRLRWTEFIHHAPKEILVRLVIPRHPLVGHGGISSERGLSSEERL